MKKKVINFLVFAVMALLMAGKANAVLAAPRLTLTPVSESYTNGSEFKVTIGVNSDGQKSSAVDVWATFDKSKLEVVSIEKSANPPFDFSMTPVYDNVAGTFQFSCPSNNSSSFEDTVIVGDLAVVTFRAKATGVASLNFTCTNGLTSDSNIFSDISDVISCSENNVGSYTITAGSSNPNPTGITPTITSTTPQTTSQVTASLPQTGNVGSTVGLIVFGVVSLASALFLKFL